MGTESSLSSGGDTSEKDPAPVLNEDQSPKRVFGSDLMVMEGDFEGLDENKLSNLDQIHQMASSVLEFSLKWEEIDERCASLENLLKERAMEAELRENSVMERAIELEKKEERLKEVEERERKIGLLEKSMTARLEEKEKENGVKQYLVSSVMILVLENTNEEAMGELEERGKEVERFSKSNDEKSHELEKTVQEFDLKQKESIERSSKEAERVKESLKQLEAWEKKLSLLDEAAKEKATELEKKEEIFETEQKAKSEEMELKSKSLEGKEKKLEEKEKELELKQRELEEGMDEREERGKEIERLSKLNDEKSRELEKTVQEFDLKQKVSIERSSKEAELSKESLKQLEAWEKELSLLDEAVEEKATELEKKEEIFEAEQKAKAKEMELKSKSLEVKEKKLEEKEKELELKQRELKEGMDEREERGKEIERLSKLNDEKSRELEKTVQDFDLKQKELIERSSKEAEMVKESLKQLEAWEMELSLLDEAAKEKATELQKKEEIFEAEQKAKAKEMERKLNERELEEGSTQAETCKRSRVQLLAEKGSEADFLTRPAKKHKSQRHGDADKLALVLSASTSSFELVHKAHEEETDKDHEQIKIVDSEFHDFKKTMSSFVVDKIWALYDPRDGMPRFYAKINRIMKSRLSLEVTWLESIDEEEESVPVACGKFTYGTRETVRHLSLSHELQAIIHGRNFMAVNPKKGETWALFRQWSKSWNKNREQHEPPYMYDLVEIVLSFDEHLGVGVSYLGKAKGFVSVFERAEQDGVFQLMIEPKEMHRFSHRVPSIRLNGEEKEGVPAGSFELDPAAVPDYILREETGRHGEDSGKAIIQILDGGWCSGESDVSSYSM